MKPINWKVCGLFFGSLAVFVVAWGLLDGLIGYRYGSAATVSYSVAIFARENPMLWGLFCFFLGAVVIGLIVHMTNPMIQPPDWEELVKLREQNKQLEMLARESLRHAFSIHSISHKEQSS